MYAMYIYFFKLNQIMIMILAIVVQLYVAVYLTVH